MSLNMADLPHIQPESSGQRRQSSTALGHDERAGVGSLARALGALTLTGT
jgi:hypothetical protein